MALKISILYCFLCLHLAPLAQTKDTYADSLTGLLNGTQNYNERIRLLGELSSYYAGKDSALAVQYGFRMLSLAQNRKDNRGAGIAHYYIGGAYFDMNLADSAINNYNQAKKYLQEDTSFYGMQTLARVWNNHGALLQRRGDEDAFVEMILNQAIPINEKIKDSIGLGRNYHSLGLSFQNVGNNARALFYQEKAATVFRNQKFVPEITDTYIKYAELLSSDITLRNKTLAENALQKADSLLQKHPDAYSALMYFNSKGIYEEVFNNNYDEALKIYIHGEQMAKENGLYAMGATLANRIYYVYNAQKKYKLALQTSQRVVNEYGKYLTPRSRLIQLGNMMQSHENLGNTFEAFRLQKQYIALNDSITRSEIAVKVHSLEQRFAAKEKENQISRLSQQMQAQELTIRQNRLWAILAVVALLLLTGFIAANYILQRKQKLIAKQEAELLQRGMEKMKQDEQIKLFSAVLEGQEQERKRLAIDLHDGLGGSLSGIKLNLSNLSMNGLNDAGKTKEHLENILLQLDGCVNELRHIARSMMPETLLKYGLDVALKDFCRGLENNQTRISFQYYGLEKNMPQATQIMVYRIIQELITNGVKHAGASQIIAQCLQNGNQLSITVEDDGKGFNLQENKIHEGMGLTNVRTRVNYLGGKLDIQAEPGIGTTINIELSYDDEEQNS